MQILLAIGLVVTELYCHKINMNTKEKDTIQSILNLNSPNGEFLCDDNTDSISNYFRIWGSQLSTRYVYNVTRPRTWSEHYGKPFESQESGKISVLHFIHSS